MERNYTNKTYLDFTAYTSLLAVLDDDDLAEAVSDAVSAATSYVKVVDEGETRIKLANFRLSGEEFREVVSTLDAARRRAHENLIACVSMLNRIAAIYKIAAIFNGEITDRWQVADFALDLTSAIFAARRP